MRLIMTGLSIATTEGDCFPCNYDIDWLIKEPSSLLWADDLMVASQIRDVILDERFLRGPLAKATKLIFEILDAEGMVSIIDPKVYFTNELSDTILRQASLDFNWFSEAHPELMIEIKEHDLTMLALGNYNYCIPKIRSIYTALVYGQFFNGTCMFGDDAHLYCENAFSRLRRDDAVEPSALKVFTEIFSAQLPNLMLYHDFALRQDSDCMKCATSSYCVNDYLTITESNTRKILKWRSYDEVEAMKATIVSIVRDLSSINNSMDIGEIKRLYEEKRRVLSRRLNKVFPKINRWSNVTTMISLPIALLGAASGSGLTMLTAGAVGGIASFANQAMKYLTSKYSWVTFKYE